MIESAIGGIAVPVFEQVWKAGGFAIDVIKKEYNKAEVVNKLIAASNRYEQKYKKRHAQIKIMPSLMKEPLPLESIYTVVKLLDDQSRRFFVSQNTIERAYRESGRRAFRIGGDIRWDGMDIANKSQYLMVLGSPGVGKSTFLRKLGLEALKKEGQIQHKCIPVFIELKEFKDETLNLKKVIAQEFETCGFPAAADFTTSMLEQGKRNASSEQWLQWAGQLESTWLEALDLDKEIITFSEAEAKALRDYLDANKLLIRCKQSAVRISRKAWEDLETKLLTLR